VSVSVAIVIQIHRGDVKVNLPQDGGRLVEHVLVNAPLDANFGQRVVADQRRAEIGDLAGIFVRISRHQMTRD